MEHSKELHESFSAFRQPSKAEYVVISPLEMNRQRFNVGDKLTLTKKEAEPLLGHTVKQVEPVTGYTPVT